MSQNLQVSETPTQSREISISETANPDAVINLVPPVVKDAIAQWLFEKPELFDKDEQALHKYLSSQETRPSPTDNRLRLKFWTEYDRVLARGESKMNMTNVIAGICTKELFYSKYLKSPNKVAWLLCPPTGYMAKANEALEFGLEQLRDILEIPHVKFEKFDARLAALKIKIVEMLDVRVKGAVVQRTMNLNVSAGAVENATAAATMEDLKRQLKELDRRNRLAQNLPLPPGDPDARPVIEVEPE